MLDFCICDQKRCRMILMPTYLIKILDKILELQNSKILCQQNLPNFILPNK